MSEPAATGPEGEQLAEGSLMSHLLELRQRLLKAVVAIGLIFIPCGYFANQLFSIIAMPLLSKLPGGKMISTSVVAPVLAPLKLAFLTSVFLAMPYVLFQMWAFISPGLYRREKRFALPLFISSILLFYCGAAFAYFIVFPLMFAFLTGTAPQGVEMMTDMTSYLDFVLFLFFAFGLAFEIPVATVLLAWTGLVRVEKMASNRGYVLIGIFILAAILTPPDAISQCFMAVPMYLLYEGGILMSRIILKEKMAAAANDGSGLKAH